jgi:hypothetical protein
MEKTKTRCGRTAQFDLDGDTVAKVAEFGKGQTFNSIVMACAQVGIQQAYDEFKSKNKPDEEIEQKKGFFLSKLFKGGKQ